MWKDSDTPEKWWNLAHSYCYPIRDSVWHRVGVIFHPCRRKTYDLKAIFRPYVDCAKHCQQSIARLTMFHKIHYCLVAVDVPLQSKQYMSPTRTENALAYHLPTSACDYYLFSFFPKTGRDWNSLPQEMVQLSTLGAFRSALQPTRLWPPWCNPVPKSSILKLALNRKKKKMPAVPKQAY